MRRKNLINEFKAYIAELWKFLKQIPGNSNSEKLYIKSNKGGFYFYVMDENHVEHYIPKSELEKIKSIAQQEYEQEIRKSTEDFIKALEKCHKILSNCMDPEEVYENLIQARKDLVIEKSPSVVDIKQFYEMDAANILPRLGFKKDAPKHYASNNLRVRSKSEVIIVEILLKLGIPFIYELPTIMNDKIIYPDFHILNVRTGKVYFYEHFGKVDDEKYRNKNLVERLNDYMEDGHFLGDDVLVSCESSDTPLNEKNLIKFFKKHFL